MKSRLIYAFMIVLMAASLSSCSREDIRTWTDPDNTSVVPVTKGNRVIYEVNLWSYSEDHSFQALEKDIPRLKELGVDILWLMPIHPRGEVNKNGEIGSPYGVRDYLEVNPAYGTKDDFRSLVNTAHSNGMELWIDWVANHTSWDNVWVKDHLDFYAEKDGERPYSPPGWYDAIQLDHGNSELMETMGDAMAYWVREFDIDGFRCDAGDRVPLEFWKGLRAKVDAVKRVTWLNEGWDTDLLEVFDYDYAWSFADALAAFGSDKDVSALRNACLDLHRDPAYEDKGRMVYLTNHDLNAFNGTEFHRFSDNVLALTVLVYTVFDLPLIYNGQEAGVDQSINFSEDMVIDWTLTNKRWTTLHKKLTLLKRTHPALEDGAERGDIYFWSVSDPNLLVFSRRRGSSEVLVALNLGDYAVQCRFKGTHPEGEWKDWFSNTWTEIRAGGFPLAENGYAVFVKD